MKYNKTTASLFALFFVVAVTGCLKDKEYDDGKIQSLRSLGTQNVVSIGLTTASTDNHLVIAFDNVNADTSFTLIPVEITNPATEDINVTLTLDPALVGNYNAISGTTAHDVTPDSVYTILNAAESTGSYVVTIPKGSNTGFLQIKINPSKYLGFDYALAFRITKVTPGYLISTNLGTGIVAIAIKNEWDGVYSYKGYSLRAGDADLTGNFSGKEIGLVTAGATSVKFATAALWGDGNGQIAIGNPVLDIDNSVTPPYPVTITSSGGGRNDPAYSSIYDPTSKTFFISFTWGAGPSARLSTDTLTYLRPR